jgi:cell wall assembly regulator SMI1
MKNVIIYDSFLPSLREEDLTAVERQLGITLPSDYRRFLLTHNGGHPEPDTFPLSSFTEGDFGVLNRFLGIREGEYDDLVNYYTKVFRDRVPRNLLPIANDPGGNLICLSVSGPDRGKVYWWFHEEEADEGEPPTYRNIYFVADSFNDLLKSLTEFLEDESG